MARSSPPLPPVLFEGEVPAYQDLRVIVDTPGLDLSIRPGSANRLDVQVVTTEGIDAPTKQALVERLQPRLAEESETVRITTASPFQSRIGEWRAQDIPVQVKLSLPNNLQVEANVSGGTLQVVGLKGRFSLVVNGGRLHVEDIEGLLDVKSRGSKVHLRHISGEHCSVEAAAGKVEVQHVAADELVFTLHACDAVCSDVGGVMEVLTSHGTLALETRNGTLHARGTRTPLTLSLARAIPAVVYSAAADVKLHLNPAEPATLNLEGTHVSLAESFSFSGEQENGLLEGNLGKGGPLIYVLSSSGAIFCSAME